MDWIIGVQGEIDKVINDYIKGTINAGDSMCEHGEGKGPGTKKVGLTLFLIIMKITIIFDNTAYDPTLQASWGFSALIEINEKKILFDTGDNGNILLSNMKKLHIDPADIDEVFYLSQSL